MRSLPPTNAEIDELTQFIPRLYRKNFRPIKEWKGVDRAEESITFPWPEYEKDVVEFMEVASKDCWLDYQYVPEEASKMLGDVESIKDASLEDIKAMLTFCIRRERFVDGHFASMIEEGKMKAILDRLVVLRNKNVQPRR